MVSVTELLLETLACLSDKEFQKFKRALTPICPERRDLDIIRMLLWIADKWYIVLVMVWSYSQKSVEMITSALLQIERSDLAEKLSQSSSGYKSKTTKMRMSENNEAFACHSEVYNLCHLLFPMMKFVIWRGEDT